MVGGIFNRRNFVAFADSSEGQSLLWASSQSDEYTTAIAASALLLRLERSYAREMTPMGWRAEIHRIATEGMAETTSGHDYARYEQLIEILGWPDETHIERARLLAAFEGVSKCGVGFTFSQADRERFEALGRLVASMNRAGPFIAASPPPTHPNLEIGTLEVASRYTTPKLSVSVVVLDADLRLLLIRRRDSGEWDIPGGMADLGNSATEIGIKEVREETGLDVRIDGLLGVVDLLQYPGNDQCLVAEWNVVLRATPVGGTLQASPVECLEARWFELDSLPPVGQCSWQQAPWADIARRAAAGDSTPFLDEPRV